MNQSDKFLPRYIQFANQIQAQVSSGALQPGEMLPPQRQLAEQFGTTLMTIRKTISVLEDEGLLRSEHGVGTFVVRPDLREEPFQLLSLSRQMNQEPTGGTDTQVLSIQSAVEHEMARKALRLSNRSGLTLLERLRIRDGVPFVYQRSYLASKYAAMLRGYTAGASLYGLLQEKTGQPMALAKEYLLPITLTAELAAHLKEEEGAPAWSSTRISANQAGIPLVYDEAILKQDSFVVTINHTGKRTNCQFHMLDETSPEPFAYLLEE